MMNEMAKKIMLLIANVELRKEIGNGGRKLYLNYCSFEKLIKDIESVYYSQPEIRP